MATVLKCKMCGGDIEVSQDMTVGKCLYCGSTMTLPKIESEKKARLFNRANEYRLNNEFDKAYDAYKTITEEDEQEAEAYWGMILSEYGVEYVEDPNSHQRIPTCHRTQIQSILDNTNYSLALKYSSGESKFMYQEEAEFLDKLQRQIISISSKLEAYDVFICYKETDDVTGERTKDSDIAENIYNELEKNGIRTFFARITLEEHLGENYEPYIYAALKSARVMLVVSTETSHCEAIWVKNEWSRFLHFMSEDAGKVLIPVYQDMNVYDFPKALANFQMQDMSKIGALNDLVRGIKKILGTTITETRDATLQALVADKLDREERNRKRNKTIKTLIGIALGLSVIVLCAIVISNTKPVRYFRAVQIMNKGNYAQASRIFEKIIGYKDSIELNSQCVSFNSQMILYHTYYNSNVGDVIQIGNGLEWTCIDKNDEFFIFLCNNVVTKKISRGELKKYLDKELAEQFFTDEEKNILFYYPENRLDIFSEEQVNLYFPNEEDRTAYNLEGKSESWYIGDKDGFKAYDVLNSEEIKFIGQNGKITMRTGKANVNYAGVRPVLYLSTQKISKIK